MVAMSSILKSAAVGLSLAAFTAPAFSVDDVAANKKRGQVYFKMVCTVCHMQAIAKSIPPSSRTMEQWRVYLDADRHDASGTTNPSVRYFMSQEYRQEIQDENKAAKKFLSLPDDQINADVREFVISGAKDSDTPASCN